MVSICIPVYNGERFLSKTIQSILNQTYKDFEFIILDNASTDKTPEIIKNFKDSRIKYYKNPKTILPQENWSKCVKLAKGDLIALYHADDIYNPDIVEEQVSFFNEHPEVGVVFTEATKIDQRDKPIGAVKLPKTMKTKSTFSFKDIFVQLIRNNYNPLLCPSCMARKKVYTEVGDYNSKDYKYVFDIDMYLRMAEVMDVGIIYASMFNYRIHSAQGSVSYSSEDRDHNEVYDMYDKFIEKHRHLLSKSDLSRYNCFKRWDYASHAIRALYKSNIFLAKHLLKKSVSGLPIFTSLTDINLFIRLTVSIFFLIVTYLCLGPFFAKLLFKFKLGYVT